MNRKFVVSWIVMFVMSLMLGFAVHGGLLAKDYARLPNLMRTMEDSQAYFPFMLAAHVLIAAGFTWIYLKGREAARPWAGQGLRFGIAVAVLMTIPTYLIFYAVMPFPSDLVAQQIVYDSVCVVLMALVLAWLNR